MCLEGYKVYKYYIKVAYFTSMTKNTDKHARSILFFNWKLNNRTY